jgi:hypothetical protein
MDPIALLLSRLQFAFTVSFRFYSIVLSEHRRDNFRVRGRKK